MPVNWKGPELATKVAQAAARAVDETTAACVVHAKSNHPWSNQTGTLEGSIQMRPAEAYGIMIRGVWGSFAVVYALFLELGTANMPAFPYLRPAADAEYPNLAARIRANLEADSA